MGSMQHTGFGATVPTARIDDLVVTQSADEVLVYDKQRHEIHHLNETSAAIWRLCDGRRSVAELAGDAGVEMEAVQLAVAKLAEANLIDGLLAPELRVSSQSRRAFLRRSAIAGAIAVPAIVSVTAPTAAQTASQCAVSKAPNGCSCSGNGNCASGNCVGGTCVA